MYDLLLSSSYFRFDFLSNFLFLYREEVVVDNVPLVGSSSNFARWGFGSILLATSMLRLLEAGSIYIKVLPFKPACVMSYRLAPPFSKILDPSLFM